MWVIRPPNPVSGLSRAGRRLCGCPGSGREKPTDLSAMYVPLTRRFHLLTCSHAHMLNDASFVHAYRRLLGLNASKSDKLWWCRMASGSSVAVANLGGLPAAQLFPLEEGF